jgi:hypothetical protein
MRLISRIRQKLHNKFLQKKLTQTKALPFLTPSKAKTVAIIYDATVLENRKAIEQFAEKLRHAGKKVTLLGFYSFKEKPNTYGRFFSKKEVNWRGVPKSAEVDLFLTETFDLMYALYIGNSLLPLDYISTLCKARFKVGDYNPAFEHYNIMISTAKNNLPHFIKLVDYHITKITKNQDELSAV